MHRPTRRWTQSLVGLAAVVVIGVGSAAPAAAHTHVTGSEPAEGAVLDTPPEQVVVRFSDPLSSARSTADLSRGGGPPTRVNARVDPQDPRRLLVSLPVVREGVYRVSYRAFGADDLHEVAGSIVFGVGTTPSTVGGQAEPPTRPTEVAARAVGDLGLALAAAGMLVLWAPSGLGPRGSGRRRAGRALRATVAGGLVGVVAGTGLALLDDARAVGGPLGGTLWRIASSTGPGRQAVLTVEAVAILAGLVALQRPTARRGAALRLPTGLPGAPTPAQLGMGLALVGVAASRSAGGHTGQGIPGVLDATVLGLHLLAGTTWVGCLLILPLVVRTTGVGWRTTVRALAPVAEALVLVTVASGLVLAAGRVATVTALLVPGYGWIVLSKAALVAVAVTFGLRMSRPRLDRMGPPGWSRGAELVAAVTLVGLAAWLTATPPANGPSFESAPSPRATTWSGAADDLAVRLQLSPNRPGANLVSVDVHDTRRPSPGEVTSVSITRVGSRGGEAVGRPSGAGRWDLGSVTLGPGAVPLVVTATRVGLPEARVALSWAVPPTPPSVHRPIVSTARLRPGLDAAAIAVILTGAILLRRRHHQLEASDAPRHDHHHRAPAPAQGPTPHDSRRSRRTPCPPGDRAGPALVGQRPGGSRWSLTRARRRAQR